jgi:steroid delta-isomerase-like uncharacterized protein
MSQAIVDAATAPILAYNAKNWDDVARAITADAVYDEVANRRVARGGSDVITLWKGWAEAMPDSNGTIESALVSGNTVILELTWRGTHTGPLRTPGGDLPATGNTFEIRACMIVDVSDGQTRVMRHYFDMATMLAQLGIAAAA